MALKKYIKEYTAPDGKRVFVILEKEYVPVKFRRHIEERGLVYKSSQWLFNYVTDYKCLKLPAGIYYVEKGEAFLKTGKFI